MKRRLTKFFALFLVLILILAGCSASLASMKFDKDAHIYRCSNGVNYLVAPSCYLPASLGEDFAMLNDTVLCRIGNLSPAEFLTENLDDINASGAGSVFYAESLHLPELSGFNAKKFYVCVEQTNVLALSELSDKALIDGIIAAFDGEKQIIPQNPSEVYHLKFVSDDYPDLFYDIVYIYADGKGYLNDRSNKCVRSTTALDAEILKNQE